MQHHGKSGELDFLIDLSQLVRTRPSFSIDWTVSVAHKRIETVIDQNLQAPHPPPLLGPQCVHWGKLNVQLH